VEAHLGDVNAALHSPAIKFFDISQKPVEFQPLRIYPPVHHCLEDEGVIGAWGKTKCQFHDFTISSKSRVIFSCSLPRAILIFQFFMFRGSTMFDMAFTAIHGIPDITQV